MRKTTIYTLLCTTLTIPGSLIAMEDKTPLSPISVAIAMKKELIEKEASKLSTPNIREQKKAELAKKNYKPNIRDIRVELEVQKARAERDTTKAAAYKELGAEEKALRLEAEKKENEIKKADAISSERMALIKQVEEAVKSQVEVSAKIKELEKKYESAQEDCKQLEEFGKETLGQLELTTTNLRDKSNEFLIAQSKLMDLEKQLNIAEAQRNEAIQIEERLKAAIAEKEAAEKEATEKEATAKEAAEKEAAAKEAAEKEAAEKEAAEKEAAEKAKADDEESLGEEIPDGTL